LLRFRPSSFVQREAPISGCLLGAVLGGGGERREWGALPRSRCSMHPIRSECGPKICALTTFRRRSRIHPACSKIWTIVNLHCINLSPSLLRHTIMPEDIANSLTSLGVCTRPPTGCDIIPITEVTQGDFIGANRERGQEVGVRQDAQ